MRPIQNNDLILLLLIQEDAGKNAFLSRVFRVPKQTMSDRVTRLRQLGYIADNGSPRYTLTHAGRQLLLEARVSANLNLLCRTKKTKKNLK